MSQTLTMDQRIEVPRRFMAEVFNGQDPERARDFFTADALWHGPSIAEVSGVDSIVGLLGAFILAAYVAFLAHPFPEDVQGRRMFEAWLAGLLEQPSLRIALWPGRWTSSPGTRGVVTTSGSVR